MRTLLVSVLLLLASTLTHAQGGLAALTQQSSEFLPVEQAYQLTVDTTGDQQLQLSWRITDGYYLYQHAFKARLETATGDIPVTLTMEPGKPKTDEFFGDVEVYYQYASVDVTAASPIGRARLAVTSQGCADAGLCYPPNTEVFTIETAAGTIESGEPNPPLVQSIDGAESGTDGTNEPSGLLSFVTAVLFAFMGGLILNAMPCVFPILSLKVLSFATGDPATHHRHSLVYTLGVVVSFVSIAAVLIALQRAGAAVGWGFQLQSPDFVIGLAYLFTAMGLSLSGVVQFGAGLMNVGSGLASQGGNRGSFFTGVLAVLVASPCTAPFMGSALGYALTQPAAVALAVFAALGLGMAAPMVMLSFSATARNALPKPGPWMERLKEFMAFPLYGTAVWLLWVAGKQAGVDTMAAALGGLVLLGLALFTYRGAVWQRGIALVLLVCAIGLATVRGAPTDAAMAPRAEGTVPWSAQSLATLRAEGKPVFVDVTADWCITCLANEQAVLFTDGMRNAFEDSGVVYMVADWTNYDPVIGEFVRSHGRYGIPLYVMYPADPDAAPVLLPQILTDSLMREALADANPRNPT